MTSSSKKIFECVVSYDDYHLLDSVVSFQPDLLTNCIYHRRWQGRFASLFSLTKLGEESPIPAFETEGWLASDLNALILRHDWFSPLESQILLGRVSRTARGAWKTLMSSGCVQQHFLSTSSAQHSRFNGLCQQKRHPFYSLNSLMDRDGWNDNLRQS